MVYFCVFCTKVFSSPEEKDFHMSTHLSVRVNCPYCTKTYKHQETLRTHIQKSHTASSLIEGPSNRANQCPKRINNECPSSSQPNTIMGPQSGGKRDVWNTSPNDDTISTKKMRQEENSPFISGNQPSLIVPSSVLPPFQSITNQPTQSSPLPYIQYTTEQVTTPIKTTREIGVQTAESRIKEYICGECGFHFDNMPQGEQIYLNHVSICVGRKNNNQ